MGVRPPLPAPYANTFKINHLADIKFVRAKNCAKNVTGLCQASPFRHHKIDNNQRRGLRFDYVQKPQRAPSQTKRMPEAERLSIFPAQILRIADARQMAIAMPIACNELMPDQLMSRMLDCENLFLIQSKRKLDE